VVKEVVTEEMIAEVVADNAETAEKDNWMY
jgi:hypothetical protein